MALATCRTAPTLTTAFSLKRAPALQRLRSFSEIPHLGDRQVVLQKSEFECPPLRTTIWSVQFHLHFKRWKNSIFIPTMLTKDQANIVSDALLASQREQHVESMNRRARGVSWFYQVNGLRTLQPYEQDQLFSAAGRFVAKKVSLWAALASFWLAVATVWYWGTPSTPIYTWVALFTYWFGTSLIRLIFLRRELSKLIDSRHSPVQR